MQGECFAIIHISAFLKLITFGQCYSFVAPTGSAFCPPLPERLGRQAGAALPESGGGSADGKGRRQKCHARAERAPWAGRIIEMYESVVVCAMRAFVEALIH